MHNLEKWSSGMFQPLNSRKHEQWRNIFAATILIVWQVLVPLGPVFNLTQGNVAYAAPNCVVDTAGVNDEPNQKDLTQLCVDYQNEPTSIDVTWNWDDLGTSGNNTMDACALFDTDGDGNVNYSVCVITEGTPATQITDSPVIYSCGDDKVDRCTQPATALSGPYTTICVVTQEDTDPFAAGDAAPQDTVASCEIILSDINNGDAELVDVCSYPSQQPNSDPSDCVIIQDRSAKIEVVKNLEPSNDTGLFNLVVADVVEAVNVGDEDSTGEVVVDAGNNDSVTVGETAGTDTTLDTYDTAIECKDLNGTGNIIASGTGTSLVVPTTVDGQDIVCVITNVASSSITIIKDTEPDSGQNFGFDTDNDQIADFTLDDDDDNTLSNTKLFNDLTPGTYTYTELPVDGWELTGLICDGNNDDESLDTRTATVNLQAGENVTCTFTNTQDGQLKVTKQTNPDSDNTEFDIQATTDDGAIRGNSNDTISHDETVTFNVAPGTYNVSESFKAGWDINDDDCQNVVVTAGQTASCTLTNSQLPQLTVNKVTNPATNVDFAFTVTSNQLTDNTTFNLSDGDSETVDGPETDYVTPGTYNISEVLPTDGNWLANGISCTNGTTAESGESDVTVTLVYGDDVECTFTNLLLGSISGTKYEVNTDGTDATPLAGWNIFIDLDGDGELDEGEETEKSQTTDANGYYEFTGLQPGTYDVWEVLQNGWTQIFSPDPIILAAGEDSTDNNDFGNFENGEISGFKYSDLNGNGQWDSETEPKLNGWEFTLILDKNDDGLFLEEPLETTTTADEAFTFNDLSPGLYQVCETQQDGWTRTEPVSSNCRTTTINLSGESVDMRFGNQPLGTITVVKDVVNDNGGELTYADFSFDLTSSTTLDSSVDVTGSYNFDETTSPDGSKTITQVPIGTYSVTELEADMNGYSTSYSDNCQQLVVSLNETTTCTITNDDDAPGLRVTKVAINNDGGAVFASDFSLYVNNESVEFRAGGDVLPESIAFGPYEGAEAGVEYTVSEDPMQGYSQVGNVVCTDMDTDQTVPHPVTLDLGQSVNCTITNDDITPTLTVIKKVINDDGGDAVVFNFDLTVNDNDLSFDTGTTTGDTTTYTATPTVLANTEYTLSEIDLAGYTEGDWDCGTPDGLSTVVNLDEGQDVTCTIANDDVAPTLTLDKIVTNDNGGDAVDTAWTLTATPSGNNDAVVVEGSDGFDDQAVFANVTYTLSEDGPVGYTAGDWDCGDYQLGEGNTLVLNEGDSLTCTITNDDIAPTLTVKKHVINDNGGDTIITDFEIELNGSGLSFGSGSITDDTTSYTATPTVESNTEYTLSEVDFAGYTEGNWGCSGAVVNTSIRSITIELDEGQNITCEVTNDDDQGTLELIKRVVTDNGGEAEQDDWTLKADGPTAVSGIDSTANEDTGFNTLVDAGSYDLSEVDGPDGYELGNLTCGPDADNQSSLTNDQVDVENGETVVCIFTNDDIAPRLTIQKWTNANDSQIEFDFELENDDFNPDFKLSNGGEQKYSNQLSAGEITITETVPAGWNQNVTISCTNVDETQDGASVDFTISLDQDVLCVFNNTELGTIIVSKLTDTIDQDPGQVFEFTSETDALNGELTSDESFDTNDSNDYRTLESGDYSVTESELEGWDLTNLTCDGEEFDEDDIANRTASINLSAGEVVECIFTNTERGNVSVTKFNDLYLDGLYDEQVREGQDIADPTLSDWTIRLNGDSLVTDENGQVKFENVKPGSHFLSEDHQEGWTQSIVYCANQDNVTPNLSIDELIRLSNLSLNPGQELECFIGNYQQPILNLAKSNNQASPQQIGETVIYTLTVSVPAENSGSAFNTTVTDLPPNGFTYIPGSWTANSSVRGDLKALGTTTEPTYASPGEWQLGTMLPGEVVILTYATLISSIVEPGDYPDFAYATAAATPDAEVNSIFSNVDDGASDPFVATSATVIEPTEVDAEFSAPEVLGVSITRLPATGFSPIQETLILMALTSVAYVLYDRRRSNALKGTK
jgi:uncharacterized repeat protein (TIGR01451 family)